MFSFSTIKNLITNNLLALVGFVMLFISCMGIWGNLIDYDIYKNGFEITANVIEAPEIAIIFHHEEVFAHWDITEKFTLKKLEINFVI